MTLTAHLIVLTLLLSAPILWRRGHLRLLLGLVLPYLGACAWLLVSVLPVHPVISVSVALVLGVLPGVVLVIWLADLRLGLFASDTFWYAAYPMFGFPLLGILAMALQLVATGSAR